MGMFPDAPHSKSDELLIIIEAVAPTQEQADTICGFARSTMPHSIRRTYSNAGTWHFLSPSDAKMGGVRV